MLQRSVESFEEHTPSAKPSLADRGIVDTLCYARLIGLPNPRFIEDACERYRYARVVFLGPSWNEIYETDGERKRSFAEAEQTYHCMVEAYRECGYETVDLPKPNPFARAWFIVKQLRLLPLKEYTDAARSYLDSKKKTDDDRK